MRMCWGKNLSSATTLPNPLRIFSKYAFPVTKNDKNNSSKSTAEKIFFVSSETSSVNVHSLAAVVAIFSHTPPTTNELSTTSTSRAGLSGGSMSPSPAVPGSWRDTPRLFVSALIMQISVFFFFAIKNNYFTNFMCFLKNHEGVCRFLRLILIIFLNHRGKGPSTHIPA